MFLYSNFHEYWVIFEVINGLLISIFSAIDIYILYNRRDDGAPLVGWALNAKKSKNGFSILLLVAALFIVVFVIYAFGSISNNHIIRMIAELIGTATYLMLSYVVLTWSRVFMRFI
jgi:ABC-type multidrug transport system fused ATPase/permease subunit